MTHKHNPIILITMLDDRLSSQARVELDSKRSGRINSLIQCDEGDNSALDSIRAALVEGELSGEPCNINSNAFKARMMVSKW